MNPSNRKPFLTQRSRLYSLAGLLVLMLSLCTSSVFAAYSFDKTSTTSGNSSWGSSILAMTASLSGSNITFTVSKSAGGSFSSSGTMFLKVGTYESSGVNRGSSKSVVANSTTTLSFTHNLNDFPNYPKDFYARYEGPNSTWAWVGPIKVSFSVPKPATPNAPTASATGTNSINLSWPAVSNAVMYGLWRADSATGTYKQIYCAASPSYADSGTHLLPTTTYYYKVKTGNSEASCSDGASGGTTGWSDFSGVGSATTQAKAPTGPSVEWMKPIENSQQYGLMVPVEAVVKNDLGIQEVFVLMKDKTGNVKKEDRVFYRWHAETTSTEIMTTVNPMSTGFTEKSAVTVSFKVTDKNGQMTEIPNSRTFSWCEKNPCADTELPTGSISGINPTYTVGETVSYQVQAQDNEALSKLNFSVVDANEALKYNNPPWDDSGTSANHSGSFSTAGWGVGTYYYALWIKDAAHNKNDYTGSFTVVSSSPNPTVSTNTNLYDDCRELTKEDIQVFLDQYKGDLKDTSLKEHYELDANDYSLKQSPTAAPTYPLVRTELQDDKAGELSPADLIYYSALENEINPVLLLAKIQQESNLISKPENDFTDYQRTLNRATGYGIPNSNSEGDYRYKSFFAQIVGLTFQFSKHRSNNKTFKEAYDSYTQDNQAGQDVSFQNFLDVYNPYVEKMNQFIHPGVCQISSQLSGSDPILTTPPKGSSGETGDNSPESCDIKEVPVNTDEPDIKSKGYQRPLNPFDQWDESHYECTRYAFGRVYEKTGKELTFSQEGGRHGGKWYDLVRGVKGSKSDLPRGTEPRSNSLVMWSDGKIGHVAFVEKVEGNKITISEANWSVSGKYNGFNNKFTKESIKERSNGKYKLVGYIYLDTLIDVPTYITTLDKKKGEIQIKGLSLAQGETPTVKVDGREVSISEKPTCEGIKLNTGVPLSNFGDQPLHLVVSNSKGDVVLDTYYPFIDAKPGQWYTKPAIQLWKLNILEGKNGILGQGQPTSRAEFLKMALLSSNKTSAANFSPKDTSFSDVSKDHWASGYIQYAKEGRMIDFVDGKDNQFRPNGSITRAEAAKITSKVLKLEPPISKIGLGSIFHSQCPKVFSDLTQNAWYCSYIADVYRHRIMTGRGEKKDKFEPMGTLTKEEPAMTICRAYSYEKQYNTGLCE